MKYVDFRLHYHHHMFKPFKFWADYTDDEFINWENGLPTDTFDELNIPPQPRNLPPVWKKKSIFTPEIRSNLKHMSFKTTIEIPKSSMELMNLLSPQSSPSPTQLSPLAKMMSPKMLLNTRRKSLDKLKLGRRKS